MSVVAGVDWTDHHQRFVLPKTTQEREKLNNRDHAHRGNDQPRFRGREVGKHYDGIPVIFTKPSEAELNQATYP